MALCNCKISKRWAFTKNKVTQIGNWDGCPLDDGHTNFMVFRCSRCKGIIGFPATNLNLALENGTLETKKKLAEIIG